MRKLIQPVQLKHPEQQREHPLGKEFRDMMRELGIYIPRNDGSF